MILQKTGFWPCCFIVCYEAVFVCMGGICQGLLSPSTPEHGCLSGFIMSPSSPFCLFAFSVFRSLQSCYFQMNLSYFVTPLEFVFHTLFFHCLLFQSVTRNFHTVLLGTIIIIIIIMFIMIYESSIFVIFSLFFYETCSLFCNFILSYYILLCCIFNSLKSIYQLVLTY